MAPKHEKPQEEEVVEPVVEEVEKVETKPQEPASVIYLLHDYGGSRTGEKRIAPGMYKADDPALMGLADYLVANGHATRD